MAKEIIRGRNLLLSVNGIVIGCATSSTLSLNRDSTEATCKDTEDEWKDFVPGDKEAELTVEALTRYFTAPDAATNIGVKTFRQLWDDGTLVDWEFTRGQVGDELVSGKGYIMRVDETAPRNDTATWSATIKPTGKVNFGVVEEEGA